MTALKVAAAALAGAMLASCAAAVPRVPDGTYHHRYGGMYRGEKSDLDMWILMLDGKIVYISADGIGGDKLPTNKYTIKSYDPETKVLMVDTPLSKYPIAYCDENAVGTFGVNAGISTKDFMDHVNKMLAKYKHGEISERPVATVCDASIGPTAIY